MTAREAAAVFLVSLAVWTAGAGLFFLAVRLTVGYWPVSP